MLSPRNVASGDRPLNLRDPRPITAAARTRSFARAWPFTTKHGTQPAAMVHKLPRSLRSGIRSPERDRTSLLILRRTTRATVRRTVPLQPCLPRQKMCRQNISSEGFACATSCDRVFICGLGGPCPLDGEWPGSGLASVRRRRKHRGGSLQKRRPHPRSASAPGPLGCRRLGRAGFRIHRNKST